MTVFYGVCSSMFWLILLSSIDSNNGWSNHHNYNRLIAGRFRNVVTVPDVRNVAPIFYPRINDEVESTKCTDGICVPHHLCVNDTIVSNGEGLIQHRMSDSDITANESNYCLDTERCCKLADEQEQEQEGSFVIDKDVESNEIPSTENHQCGKRTYFGLESRISGGDAAQYAEFPWMIIILTKSENSSALAYKCGGSLIHPSVVLTSAHCIDSTKPGRLTIRAGDWDTSRLDEEFPHQDRDVRSIIIHKGYTKASLRNDIALLILTKPVELTENVNTVCLPPMNYNFDGRRCFVAGWGKDSYGEKGVYQAILKKVEVPIIPRDVCQRKLRNTFLGKYFRLHRSFICAGGESGDSCKGDGGSPLMCSDPQGADGIFYQVGIVAWGIGCNQANVPAGYVNVAGLRRWIDHEIKIRHLEMEHYIGKLI